MNSNQRLSDAYMQGRVLEFDQHSKFVIVSDCHRGDGSASDEYTRNENTFLYAMAYYYKHGFTYIEAGDGDELWEHQKFNVIKNAHYDSFDAIQKFHAEDRFILMYGNHNIYLKDPEYVKSHLYHYENKYTGITRDFFKDIEPCESLVLKNRNSGQEILVVHGHQGDVPNDQLWFFSMLSLKYFWRFLHATGFRNPASPVKNEHKRHKIERIYNRWIDENRMMLICGHTHRVKYPRPEELPYFNTGCCIYPSSMTAIEIENEHIRIIRWKIRSNSEGILQVTRNTIHGPDPLSKFDIRIK